MSDASELFALLAADQRRRLLFLLCDRERARLPEGLLTRSSTATGDADDGRTAAGQPATQSPTDASRLEAVLVHHHLPKLEDAGLIEWDREEGVARRGPDFEAVEPALRVLAGHAEAFPHGLR